MRTNQKRRRIFMAFMGLGLIFSLAFLVPWVMRQRMVAGGWGRPYGMAPMAFQAFRAACKDSGIGPVRIGQTIGNAPMSVGYHKKDGVVTVKGKRYDYCAAVDLGVGDLNRKGINLFLHNMTKRGFACWYREKGHWTGKEHVHAVYALLPMKPQLRGQVKLFLRERRAKGIKPLEWERKVQRNHFALMMPKPSR